MLLGKRVTIVACKQAPQFIGETYSIVDETKHTFVFTKQINLIVDKKMRLRKAGLEIMVGNSQ